MKLSILLTKKEKDRILAAKEKDEILSGAKYTIGRWVRELFFKIMSSKSDYNCPFCSKNGMEFDPKEYTWPIAMTMSPNQRKELDELIFGMSISPSVFVRLWVMANLPGKG